MRYIFTASVTYPTEKERVLTPTFEHCDGFQVGNLVDRLLSTEQEATQFVIVITREQDA